MKLVSCNIFQMPKTYHGLGHYILSPWNGFIQRRSITCKLSTSIPLQQLLRKSRPNLSRETSGPSPPSPRKRLPAWHVCPWQRLAKGTHIKPGLLKPNFLIWGVSLVELNKGQGGPFFGQKHGDPRRIWGFLVLDISLHHRSVEIWGKRRKLGERSLSWWLEDHLLESLFEQMLFNGLVMSCL